MNIFDQLISAVAPRAAVRRQAARLQLDHLRRLDAAGRGRRTENWRTNGASADAAVAPGFAITRDRARDLVRNNPYASKIIDVWTTNLIGGGWSFKAKARRSNSARRAQTATEEFRAWAADPKQCDYDGLLNFDGLCALAVRSWKETGEVLIRRRTPASGSGLRIPLQLQVLEADWIDESHDGLNQMAGAPDGGFTHRGIEYDAEGRRTAYWIYNTHPGESTVRVLSPLSNRVPADQMIHLFTRARPQQTRGITCLAPVVLPLRDLDDYLDAQLLKQKVSACMTGVIVDPDGVGDQKETVGQRMEPGSMVRLGLGQDIRFSSPPSVGEIDKVLRGYLLRIAAGAQIPYEELTGDFSMTNYSAGRLGWLAFQRRITSETWQQLAPNLFHQVWEWFSDRAASVGVIAADGLVDDWTPPRREQYDPGNETRATIARIRGGLKPPQEAIREEGLEPDEVLAAYQEWNQMMDARGITLDTDPRKVSAQGLTQARPLGSVLPPAGEPPLEAEPVPEAAATAPP